MSIIIKKVTENEKLAVIPFLVDEYENLILELNPNLRFSYSGDRKVMMRELDQERLLLQIDDNSVVYAAYDDNELIGAGFIDSKGYLDSLYVKKEYRDKTIGSQLLRNLIEDSKHFDLIKVHANVNSIHLYERFSFHIVDDKGNSVFVPMELERRHYGK